MNSQQPIQDLNFDRSLPRVPRRLVIVGLPLILTVLAWRFLPPNTFFWLAFLSVGVLAWAASFGWRLALSTLIDYLIHLTMQ